jgi:rhodanese-related sulfurtransferase
MISLLKSIFFRLLLIVPVISAASVFLTGCASDKAVVISQNELSHQIKSDGPLTIIDVRSFEEYEDGHIPGAIHIPWWSVFTRHSKIPSAHEVPIIIYCEHGPRAKLAKLAFRIVGFQEIRYLEGHMSSWKQANLPVEKSASP